MLLSFCKMVGIHELYYSKDADIVDKTHLLGTNLARPCFTGLSYWLQRTRPSVTETSFTSREWQHIFIISHP